MTTDIWTATKPFQKQVLGNFCSLVAKCDKRSSETLGSKSYGSPKCHARKQSDLKLLSLMESNMCHFLDNFPLSGPLTCKVWSAQKLSEVDKISEIHLLSKFWFDNFICVDIHYLVLDAFKSNLIPIWYKTLRKEFLYCKLLINCNVQLTISLSTLLTHNQCTDNLN